MLGHNKFILGILTFAISTSIIGYNTTIKANAKSIEEVAYNAEYDENLHIYEAVDKNGVTWEYKELSDGTIYLERAKNVQAYMEVPSNLNGKTVSIIGDVVQHVFDAYVPTNERCDSILQSIKIPETIKFISPNAFHCINLVEVQLPATTLVGDNAFAFTPWFQKQRNSQGLVIINGKICDVRNATGDITIPSNVKIIVSNAFKKQQGMTSVTIPSSVIEIDSGAFRYCYNMKNVILGSGITEIKDGTFSDCSSLESIIIPNSVTQIGPSAFSQCSKLKSITIPDSVTKIDSYAFSGCSSLEEVKILNKNIYLSTKAFIECQKLTNVELPSNATLEDKVFDDGVTIIKNGVSNNNKQSNNTSTNTANNSAQPATIIPGGASQIQKGQQGWHKAADGEHWNCLWNDGSYRYGWYDENGEWYYFYGNGQMATEFIDLGSGCSYYLKPNSVDGKASMVTGWQYINGDWFYFNPNSDGYRGAMKRACWYYIGGNWYYFYYDGTMAHNAYIDGYYVNSSGAWVK